MDEIEKFNQQKKQNIEELGRDEKLLKKGKDFITETAPYQYSYNFTWLGRPIIQVPQDIIALQEIIWEVKPDLVVETGIAHGGSLIFSASILELIGGNGHVLGIDIDIRQHNRAAIEAHPMSKRITMIQGSSVDSGVVSKVHEFAKNYKRILVLLDSNHSHEHVLEELKVYSTLVSLNSYCIVYDTVVEDMPADHDWKGRPWGKGNNPKTAIFEFLKNNSNFEINKRIDAKLLISVAPDGYLKRIK